MAHERTAPDKTPGATTPTSAVERDTHPLLTAAYWRQLARSRITWAVLLVAAEMLALSLLAPGSTRAIGLGQVVLLKLVGVVLLVTLYLLYVRLRPLLRELLGPNVWVNRLVTYGLAGVYVSTVLFVIAIGVPPIQGGPVPVVEEFMGTVGAGAALLGGALSYILTK